MRTVIDLSNHIHRRVAFTVAIKVTSRLFAMPTNIHSASKHRDYTMFLDSLHPFVRALKAPKTDFLLLDDILLIG